MKSLKGLALKNKRVFLRLDLNVSLQNGKILDDYRIQNALPTIEYILKKGAKQIILASHLGRPKGHDMKYSLAPVAERLAKLLERPIYLHNDVTKPIEIPEPIVLLENLRFWEEEKKGSISFAKKLAQHADVYVDDAFGTAHRKDASVYALAKLLPGAPGLLIEKELKNVHLNHKKPIVAIFGPAKISDKIIFLEKLLQRVDKLVLGGAVVFTFLGAMGIPTGKSLIEPEMFGQAKKLMKKYGDKIIFPTDFAVASPSALKKFGKLSVAERKKLVSVVDFEAILKSKAAYDVGPKSVKLFSAVIARAKTVVWNGPLGLYEIKPYDKSTNAITKFIAEKKITAIICGGDTADAIRRTPYTKAMTHISTGGGSSLKLLSGEKLPAIEVFKKK